MFLMVSDASSDRRSPQHGEHRPIPKPLLRSDIRRVQERLRLLKRQPVPYANTISPVLPFRAIPEANCGASNPLSAASLASFRTAVIRTSIEIGPSALLPTSLVAGVGRDGVRQESQPAAGGRCG